MFGQADIIGLLPELILAGLAMLYLIVGVSLRKIGPRVFAGLAIGALLAALGVTIFGISSPDAQGSVFGGAFVVDSFSVVGRSIIYVAAGIALAMATRHFDDEKLWKFEYPILVMLACVGMGLMVSAQDLIAVYMGIELQSLSLYIMAAFNRDSRRSTEAGLKYFVLGALSSGMLLYGASLVYGFTGQTSFSGIAAMAGEADNVVGLTFGLVFLIAGLAFKVSAAPFHMWTPDVYEGAPTPVTAFFAAAPKIAAMFLFVRILIEAFPSLLDQWQPVLWIAAALSMIIGAVSALVQTNIKRLMAYSSIGHVGYALIGLTAGTEAGVQAVVFYLAIYAIMTLGTFACILSMRRPEGMTENIEDLSGLSQSQPGLALAFTLLFLSLAGIPPLLGFFGKFAVFMAGIEAELYILSVIGVLSSVVATFYYLGVIRTIWFSEPAPAFARNVGGSISMTAWASALIVAFGLIFLIRPLTSLASYAAQALF